MISTILFFILIVTGVIFCISLIISIIYPNYRIWPPPKKSSWQFYFIWILTIVLYIGFILLGIFDWDSFIFGHFSRFIIGGLLVAGGLLFFICSISTLKVHSTLGLKGELITSGPYKYSRNPQYVSNIALILGLIFIFNSLLAFIAGLLGIILFLITPFAEEPWLKEQFGIKYEEYCKKVRRFI